MIENYTRGSSMLDLIKNTFNLYGVSNRLNSWGEIDCKLVAGNDWGENIQINLITRGNKDKIERLLFIRGLDYAIEGIGILGDKNEDSHRIYVMIKDVGDIDKILGCMDLLMDKFEWEYDKEYYERFFNAR